MKWLSPLRNTGRNSCPQCRAKVFDKWTSKDFPPPPPVVPLGNGPAERAAQVNIASSALRNIQALLPPGGTADFEVEGVGHVRVGRPRPAEYRNGALDARARPEMRGYPALPEANSAGEASDATIAAANQRYRPERAPRVYGQAHEPGEGPGPPEPLRNTRRAETRRDNTRSRSAETHTARNVPRRPAAITVDEVVLPTPEQTNRNTSRSAPFDRAPTDIFPPATISTGSAVTPVRSSNTTATSARLLAENPSIFDTYLNFWASERRPRREA